MATWADSYPTAVIRYVPTHIGRDGLRTLSLAAQGRNTYETARDAAHWIDAVRAQNQWESIASIFGPDDTFEVCACPCWPGHFTPCGVYFDDEDIVR
jgi:hypothetical protein